MSDLPRKKQAWTYICGICRMPILTHVHSRHTTANGSYHMTCEGGRRPLYAEQLPRLAREGR